MSSKLVIIEGMDRVGKDTLAKGLTQDYTTYGVRHFSKPPKGLDLPQMMAWQSIFFQSECELALHFLNTNSQDSILIWNRSHIGEYVYGPLYRDIPDLSQMQLIERLHLGKLLDQVYLVYLYGDVKFIASQDDGHSLRSPDRTIEEERKEEHNLFLQTLKTETLISNQTMIEVAGPEGYINKEDVLRYAKAYIGNHE